MPASAVHDSFATGVTVNESGLLGVSGISLTPAIARQLGLPREQGLLVGGVVEASPAAAAGVQPGDIVVGVGGRPVGGFKELVAALSGLPLGGAVDLRLVRQGTERTTIIRLVEAPASA